VHKLYKSSRLVRNYNIFTIFFSKLDYKDHINNIQNNLRTHPREFGNRYINNKHHSNFLPKSMH